MFTISGTAQTIIPIHNIPNDLPRNSIYYKDVENDLTSIKNNGNGKKNIVHLP
ncbi:hypothetical protein [Dokdonia sp. Hel_I_53]|uniref:hypothetical protein n=1 Tax=Dokdonia sp. Hel_I_53 TaxID=1566287 RepID=UPI001646F846|nr:hypothetical protein [Dokdonia sp. Hel_I_53]